MMQNKNRLFGRHFERYNILTVFFAEQWSFIVQLLYVVQISLQNSGGKAVFGGGGGSIPLGTNGSENTLVT